MQQFLLVKLNKSLYGLDIMKVKSIEQNQKIQPSTCLGSQWVGMINLRGEIIKITNGESKLAYKAKDDQLNTNNIVIFQSEGTKYGLIVDEACTIHEIKEEEELANVPAVVKSDILSGILKYKEDLVSLINVDKLVTA